MDSSVDGTVDANPFLHAPVPVKTESEPLVLHPHQRHNVGADPPASVSPHVVAGSSLSPLSYVVAVKEATVLRIFPEPQSLRFATVFANQGVFLIHIANRKAWNNGKSALDLSDDSLLTSTVIIKPKVRT